MTYFAFRALFPDHLQATGHVLFITTFFAFSGIVGSLIGGAMIDLIGVSTMYFYMGKDYQTALETVVFNRRIIDAKLIDG